MEMNPMKFRPFLAVTSFLVASVVSISVAGGGANFDKLTDINRKVFQARFNKEIWPLLHRGGKSGCTSCHNGKVVSALKFSGNPDKDFPILLKAGFFIPGDSGSLLTRITSKNKNQMMPPPGKAERWKDADVQVLQKFVDDLEAKQKK